MAGFIVTAHFLTKSGRDKNLTHSFPNCMTRASAEACARHFFGRKSRSIYKLEIIES